MSKLNELRCATNKRNVGFGNCVVDWKIIAGFFLYDSPRTFTPAELEVILETLQTDAWKDAKATRCFPVHKVFQWTDNSEDVTIQTSDLGKKIPVKDGDYDWTAQTTEGGACLLESLQSHNGNVHVLFYDKEGKIIGTNSNGALKTIPVLFHALPWKMAGGSAVAQYLTRFIFSPEYVNQGNSAFVKVNFTDIEEVAGLQDLELFVEEFSDGGGVAQVTVRTKCGASNVGETYSTELANMSLWQAINQSTGGVITISSVVWSATTKRFTVTLDRAADGDYPDDGVIELSLKAPSVLAAADIEGYESIPAELEVSNS